MIRKKINYDLSGRSNADVLRLRMRIEENYHVLNCKVSKGIITFEVLESINTSPLSDYGSIKLGNGRAKCLSINERFL